MDLLQDVDDPRITSQFIRGVAEWSGSLTLVGVVHDHPASVYRVRHVIEEADPDVLALELPPLSISTYKRYAGDDKVPPATGGEMSAAIQTATTDEVLGIDGPSTRYLGNVVRTLLKQPDPILARNVLATFTSVTKSVIENRVRPKNTPRQSSLDFQAGQSDPPQVQAQHERQHIQKSRVLLDSLQENRTKTALEVENSTRERHMVDRLQSSCRNRDAVAVVGIHHLEELETQLERQKTLAR